jgi:putative glutamine amidotransferase
MSAPIIGLSTYRTPGSMTIYDGELAVLPAQYVDAVTRSGGLAVLVPPQGATLDDAKALVGTLDGLIIAGGADVNPRRYGEEPGPHTQEPEDLRDDWEALLLEAALDISLPLLGICRGAQMINVHLGGTLHQHLPDVVGHHRYQVGDGVFHDEIMTLVPGTKVAQIFGDQATTIGSVYHHQGINQVAPGLTVSARGFDGVVQAIEIDSYPFGVAVQWHPEENLADLRLCEALVVAAQR